MSVMFRYLLRHFLAGFLKVAGVTLGLLVLVDGIGTVQRFAPRPGFNWEQVGLLIAWRIPGLLTLLIPAMAFLATLLVTARLSRQHEITVMRGSGWSGLRIVLPFLCGGLLVAAGQALLLDRVVPHSRQVVSGLKDALSGVPLRSPGRSGGQWHRDGDRLIHVTRTDGENAVFADVAILVSAADQRPVTLLEARRATGQPGGLLLEEGELFTFGEGAALTPFDHRFQPLGIDPAQLGRPTPGAEGLSNRALAAEAGRLRAVGHDATAHRVTLLGRHAAPVITLTAIWLAFPFALGLARQGGFTRFVLAGLLMGLALFVVTDLATALGLGGRLPPLLAVWSPVVLFGGVGLLLLLRREAPQ